MPSFGALGVAAYCPRQLWYHRQQDDTVSRASTARRLAQNYEALLAERIPAHELAIQPVTVASRLEHARARLGELWDRIADPAATSVVLEGHKASGEVAKLLDTDPPTPTIVSGGTPPQDGVWQSHAVRATAAARALERNHTTGVKTAFVEYPRHGRIRRIRITADRRRTYHRLVETVERMDKPPSRIDNAQKCKACQYQGDCGTTTQTLATLFS